MDDILVILLVTWLACLLYIWYNFEDYKNWREQDQFMKLVLFHIGGGFLLTNFVLVLYFLNRAGIIG